MAITTTLAEKLTRRSSGYDHVLEPGRIGPVELINRVILPAMDMNMCDDGAITDAEIAHYTAVPLVARRC